MCYRPGMPRALLVSLFCCVAATAQTVWSVSGYTSIQPAIDAASPGDVIELTNGPAFWDYQPFLLDKGLTIRGNGCRIAADPSTPYANSWIRVALPPGQVAYLEDIDGFAAYSGGSADVGTPIEVLAGTLHLDGYTFRGHRIGLVATDATVVMSRSSLISDGTGNVLPAVDASNCSLTVHDCVLEGGTVSGLSFGMTPGPAVRMTDSTLHAENSTFVGGGDVSYFADGAPAIDATNCQAWLASCVLVGGDSALGAGGAALQNLGPNAFDLSATTLTPGLPGGAPSVGPVDPNVTMLRLDVTPAWTRGLTSTVTIEGAPGAFYSLWVAPDVLPTQLPLLHEPVWALAGGPVLSGLLAPTGSAAHDVLIPNLAALQHVPVFAQAVGGVQFPLRASVVGGNPVR